MAQIGSFVPATAARVGLVDRIFVRAGASDDIARGRSTFLVEMSETAYILRHATERSLVVLDEVGRGTSTYDGMGLAWAVGEDLHDRIGARTLFATHFYELTGLADGLNGARNCCMAAREQGDEVVFLYRLVEGGADRSYGVQVARLAGIPDHVVERAREVMERLGRVANGKSQMANRNSQVASGESQGAVGLREVGEGYVVGGEGKRVVVAGGEEVTEEALREILGLDIANLTPVQALVVLNDLQQRLRGEDGG
jgi:DNA mismatch repair protein MutS